MEISKELHLWISLTSSSSFLTPRTVVELQRVLRAIREFASLQWGFAEPALAEIRLWKVDFTLDLQGSFITSPTSESKIMVRDTVKTCVETILSDPESTCNFLQAIPIHDLSVSQAPNNLNSCY